MVTGIPLSQEVILHDWKNSFHGTSSTLQFLDHRCPVAGKLVARLINYSSIFNWTLSTLARQPSKVMENCRATQRLKPSNLCINGSHPFSSRSLWALSNINRVWIPWGSARTTGAMNRAHGKGLVRIHQRTGAESFGLTAMNNQRGSINVRMRGWWSYSPPCTIVMVKYNRKVPHLFKQS